MSNEEIKILLVEDDELDIEGITRALVKAGISNPVYIAKDGIEALEILRGEKGNLKIDRPYLIILDLNMPRMSGLEFLEEIRIDENLADSLVFVLTTSDANKDRKDAYDNHVAAYILKEKVGTDSNQLANLLVQYCDIVEFPVDLVE